MPPLLSGCGDECGWIAAGIGALAYGSFGVPVRDTHHIAVHPLVLQSFKTICFFVFGWCIVVPCLLDPETEHVQWTWWGLVSGGLWIVGGTGGIYAIRQAGLALAVGTWASIMILVNFIWGIGVFQEPIQNVYMTMAAFLLLTLGIIGMSRFSSNNNSHNNKRKTTALHPQSLNIPLLPKHMQALPGIHKAKKKEKDDYDNYDDGYDHHHHHHNEMQTSSSSPLEQHDVVLVSALTETQDVSSRQNIFVVSSQQQQAAANNVNFTDDMNNNNICNNNHSGTSKLDDAAAAMAEVDCEMADYNGEPEHNHLVTLCLWSPNNNNNKNRFCITVTQRTAGIWGAVANGVLSGSSLIPLHFVKQQGLGGALYIPSFCTGALIANIIIWMLLFLCRYQHSIGYTLRHAMPAWHLRQLALPGMAAGTLLSVGMLGSVLATTYLGQGIGNSAVQAKILVSGLWGICYFKEVQGRQQQLKWFASAILSVTGILLLSHQRIAATTAMTLVDEQEHE